MKAGRCGFEYRGLPSCASPPLCFLHLLWWQQQLSASTEPFVRPLDALPPAAGCFCCPVLGSVLFHVKGWSRVENKDSSPSARSQLGRAFGPAFRNQTTTVPAGWRPRARHHQGFYSPG